jgi:hypothetical protein
MPIVFLQILIRLCLGRLWRLLASKAKMSEQLVVMLKVSTV